MWPLRVEKPKVETMSGLVIGLQIALLTKTAPTMYWPKGLPK